MREGAGWPGGADATLFFMVVRKRFQAIALSLCTPVLCSLAASVCCLSANPPVTAPSRVLPVLRSGSFSIVYSISVTSQLVNVSHFGVLPLLLRSGSFSDEDDSFSNASPVGGDPRGLATRVMDLRCGAAALHWSFFLLKCTLTQH